MQRDRLLPSLSDFIMLEHGLKVFWRALRANWIPAIGIWIFGVLMVVDFHRGGCVVGMAEWVMTMRGRLGLLYPLLSMVIFAAILPSIAQIAIKPAERSMTLRRLPWIVPFWAYKGLEVEFLYKLQAHIWGTGADFWTVVAKVSVDQFVYNPCLGAITTILYLRWVARRIGELPQDTPVAPRGWYGLLVVPLLIATWALWVPAVSLVYLMPTPLQLPLSNLIMVLWAMMLVLLAREPGNT